MRTLRICTRRRRADRRRSPSFLIRKKSTGSRGSNDGDGMLASVLPWQEIVIPHANLKVIDGMLTDQTPLDSAVAAIAALNSADFG